MRSNPGGQIAASEVIGRGVLIERLWRVLEQRSLVLSAERRVGKTSVIVKMKAEAPPDKLTFFWDLEGVHSTAEFAKTVFHTVKSHLSSKTQNTKRVRAWLPHLSELDLKFVKLPKVAPPDWKSLLTDTLSDLVQHQKQRTVVLFWDEMPLMLYNIKQREGETVAMELLDTLRSLRQAHPTLRMVYTGSISLHNVIASLKRAKYANDPTNDMAHEDVPPLAPDDAAELARLLLIGGNISTDDLLATARAIAKAVDGFPFFIHHLVDQMEQLETGINATTVDEILGACLTDAQDRWHLGYYRQRIDTYYTPDECAFALPLLDALAVADTPLAFDDLFDRLKSRVQTEDIEKTRYVLTLLQRDHYVLQHPDGAHGFRFPLIQRYWRLNRGLIG